MDSEPFSITSLTTCTYDNNYQPPHKVKFDLQDDLKTSKSVTEFCNK